MRAVLILPWLTIALVSAATYSRLTRGSLLELRSALIPVLTQLGIDVGALLGDAIITETVFGLPGLGRLAVQSVTTQDLPVIVGAGPPGPPILTVGILDRVTFPSTLNCFGRSRIRTDRPARSRRRMHGRNQP